MTEEKQTTENTAPETVPESLNDLKRKMKLTGTVTRLELYGAFIDIGVGVDALIHISQLGKEHVNRVSDVLSVGDEVTVWVDKVDPERDQVMVSMIEPLDVDWNDLKKGQVYTGTVTRLENFGAFVDIGAEREGLVHISELSHDFVNHPKEVANVGDEVQVQVLGFSKRKRRIDLSMKALEEKPEQEAPSGGDTSPPEGHYEDDQDDEMLTAMEIAMRKALGEELPDQRKGGKGRRRRRRDKRHQQEDILNRTLHMQQES
jgi:ribosomal protein S1